MRRRGRSGSGEKYSQNEQAAPETLEILAGYPSVDPDSASISDRYRQQAEVVMRLAAKAESPAEKDVYLSIAEGWRKLAAEALRNERQDLPRETRTFRHDPKR